MSFVVSAEVRARRLGLRRPAARDLGGCGALLRSEPVRCSGAACEAAPARHPAPEAA